MRVCPPLTFALPLRRSGPDARSCHKMCMDEDAVSLGACCDTAGWVRVRVRVGDGVWPAQQCADAAAHHSPNRAAYAQGHIYLLGKYMDIDTRKVRPLSSDFYRYDVATHVWTLLSGDTAATGGPRLIYDHQMALDSDGKLLYVFGGR